MAPRPSRPKPPHPSRGAIRLRFVQRDDEPTTTSFVSVGRSLGVIRLQSSGK
jgi:hypothetical protein